jgi:glycosyltransferase involved in cell wall biosynthesis
MSLPGAERVGVSLVVPLRNEELRLQSFVDAVKPRYGQPIGPALFLHEIVLVDDASTDATPALLAAVAAETGWTVVAASKTSRGKGDAVARAAAVATAPLLLLSDVDLAAPLSEAPKLAAALDAGAAIAIGSRDVRGSSVTAPKSRMVVGRGFNALVRAVTGLEVRDTQCGFKLMPVDLARSLLSSLLVPGLAFDVELLMRARAGGYSVTEVPIVYQHGEQSRVRPIVHSAGMGRDVLRLAYHLRLAPALFRRRSDAEAPV